MIFQNASLLREILDSFSKVAKKPEKLFLLVPHPHSHYYDEKLPDSPKLFICSKNTEGKNNKAIRFIFALSSTGRVIKLSELL